MRVKPWLLITGACVAAAAGAQVPQLPVRGSDEVARIYAGLSASQREDFKDLARRSANNDTAALDALMQRYCGDCTVTKRQPRSPGESAYVQVVRAGGDEGELASPLTAAAPAPKAATTPMPAPAPRPTQARCGGTQERDPRTGQCY